MSELYACWTVCGRVGWASHVWEGFEFGLAAWTRSITCIAAVAEVVICERRRALDNCLCD